jgi:hypothetical protein
LILFKNSEFYLKKIGTDKIKIDRI